MHETYEIILKNIFKKKYVSGNNQDSQNAHNKTLILLKKAMVHRILMLYDALSSP